MVVCLGEGGCYSWIEWVGEFDEIFKGDWEKGEGRGVEEGENDVWFRYGLGFWYLDKNEVVDGNEWYKDFDCEEEFFCFVDDGGGIV